MAESKTKPNSGAAVLDKYANGDDFESQSEWYEKRQIQRDNRIRLKKLSHVRYQHPNLDEIDSFLTGTHAATDGFTNGQCAYLSLIDFGMEAIKKAGDEVWYKGSGPDPYVYYACKGPKKFLGGVFEVETKEELEK